MVKGNCTHSCGDTDMEGSLPRVPEQSIKFIVVSPEEGCRTLMLQKTVCYSQRQNIAHLHCEKF